MNKIIKKQYLLLIYPFVYLLYPSQAFAHGLPSSNVMFGYLVAYLFLHFGCLFYLYRFTLKDNKRKLFLTLSLLSILIFWVVLISIFGFNYDNQKYIDFVFSSILPILLFLPLVLSVILFIKQRIFKKT